MKKSDLISTLNSRIAFLSENDYNLIYISCYPIIRNMVLKNKGTTDDAKDIFQESLIVLYENVKNKPSFQLDSSVSTYLYSIARNKWLKQLDYAHKFSPINLNHSEKTEDVDELTYEKQLLLSRYICKLSEQNQKLITSFLEGIPGQKACELLGYSSYTYYRVAKNRCLNQLKNMLRNDKAFADLF